MAQEGTHAWPPAAPERADGVPVHYLVRVDAVDAKAIASCQGQAGVVLVEGDVQQALLIARARERHCRPGVSALLHTVDDCSNADLYKSFRLLASTCKWWPCHERMHTLPKVERSGSFARIHTLHRHVYVGPSV
jgi:hypothetical protein